MVYLFFCNKMLPLVSVDSSKLMFPRSSTLANVAMIMPISLEVKANETNEICTSWNHFTSSIPYTVGLGFDLR